jgi:hypothetical protein
MVNIQRLELENVIELATAVVEAVPSDYADPNADAAGGCQYVTDNACSCIVARIYEAAGLHLDIIKSWDTAVDGISQSIDDIEANGLLGLDTAPDALDFLVALQSRQDHGATWRGALDSAISSIND